MKKGIIAIAAVALLTSATYVGYTLKPNTAEVNQVNGLYVFQNSSPVSEFDFLGTVNMPELVWNGKPAEMLKIATKRGSKQFPDANAIIFKSDNFGKVEALKIK